MSSQHGKVPVARRDIIAGAACLGFTPIRCTSATAAADLSMPFVPRSCSVDSARQEKS